MGLSWLIRFKGRSLLYSVEFNHNNAGDGQAVNSRGEVILTVDGGLNTNAKSRVRV